LKYLSQVYEHYELDWLFVKTTIINNQRKVVLRGYYPVVASLLITLLFISSCKNKNYTAPADALFQTVSSRESGIEFRNDVKDDTIFNELNYRNFYNGGGVAIGDINNDGLPDVFMTANAGKNKLFLNKGNFKFEDITDRSGIVKKHKWSTGVAMADVNGDGLLDIYVCTAGNLRVIRGKMNCL
jgi:hypothetical protein